MRRTPTASARPSRRALAALALGAAGLVAPLSATPSVASPTSLCQRISPSQVSSALGVRVTLSDKQVNGSVTVCWYRAGALSRAAFVRTQTSDNLAGFNADRKLAAKYGESPKPDTHFAPYPAFSTSVGSAPYGVTYSVTVLKRSVEVQAGSSKAALARVERLASLVLSKS